MNSNKGLYSGSLITYFLVNEHLILTIYIFTHFNLIVNIYHFLHIMLDNEVIMVRITMEIPLKELTAQWVVGQINRDDNITEYEAICKHTHHI